MGWIEPQGGFGVGRPGRLGISRVQLAGCGRVQPPATWCCSPVRPVPPPAKTTIADVYCPAIDIPEGGSSFRPFPAVGGRSRLSRSQIALGQIARECVGQPGRHHHWSGSASRARALLGVGGSPGRYDVPGPHPGENDSTSIASRSRRVASSIPAGDTQATSSRSSRRASSFRRGMPASSRSRLVSAAASRRGAPAADARLEVTLGQRSAQLLPAGPAMRRGSCRSAARPGR